MTKQRHLAALTLILLAGAVPLLAQVGGEKTQLGFNVGYEFIPSNSLTAAAAGTGNPNINDTGSLALQLNYGRRIHDFHRTQLWLDVPALVGPNHKINNGNPLLPTSNATFYVAPSARLAYDTGHAITPWVSISAGYGLFETSDFFAGGRNNPIIHTNTGVVQFGAGADVKTPFRIPKVLGLPGNFPIGLRGEFRDFYALSQPTYPVAVTGGSHITSPSPAASFSASKVC